MSELDPEHQDILDRAAALLEGGRRRMDAAMWWRGYELAKREQADNPRSDSAKALVANFEREKRAYHYNENEKTSQPTQSPKMPNNNKKDTTTTRDPRLELTTAKSIRDRQCVQDFRDAMCDLDRARCVDSLLTPHFNLS
jgi:hypothetical protein